MQKLFFVLTTLLIIKGNAIKAQLTDTTSYSFQAAEKIFLQRNLSLLAAKYNIDVNKALIKQARLWDNPVLATDQNVYDGEKNGGKFFRHDGDNGQVFVQVTQLIKTAGKRSKLAQLAADNTTLAIAQFEDVMRSLRYSLRSDLLEINHQLSIKKIYDAEITELQRLVSGMDEELKAGNIALKDNLRVKALLFSLQNELVNITSAIFPAESELKLLLQSSGNSFITPDSLLYLSAGLTAGVVPSLDSLVKRAISSRPDAQIARASLDYQYHNLIYQKALAKPDVTIGTEYDQHSSYSPNYVGLSIGLPINIFNKNQGNIQSAEYSIKQQETLNNFQYSKIENEVTAALNKLHYFQQINNTQQLDFSKKYDALFQNMVKSYRARQISLLEFLDFVDSYKDIKLKLIEQQNNFFKAIEELNYTTNSTIINIQ